MAMGFMTGVQFTTGAGTFFFSCHHSLTGLGAYPAFFKWVRRLSFPRGKVGEVSSSALICLLRRGCSTSILTPLRASQMQGIRIFTLRISHLMSTTACRRVIESILSSADCLTL